ncbi:hypothetical protein [Methylotuvimicrobium buryatense]|uniref:Uncharacterized protein n=1 Tax=Methylotuvimicrobium buryatense TaxID=95641 RepID=A0A4P9UQH3_METBY|nr:hypothetical protein [Methylotuvimicrobium buryatense]QCW83668.1 hypothetical protein EQU24_16525 [Methylotuvimicrobium buryatense]
MKHEPVALPNLGRMMVFVDGENLVLRFQAMVAEGRMPIDDIAYEKDIYVWSNGSVWPGLNQV